MKGARQAPQLAVRMPQELKTYIHQRADENHRTLNGEILFRLEQSVKAEAKNDQPTTA